MQTARSGAAAADDLPGAHPDADLVLADVVGLAARVADGHRTVVGEGHGVVQHLVQFLRARRSEHAHPWDAGQHRQVVDAVVAGRRRGR